MCPNVTHSQCQLFLHKFNKLTHNCASYSVFGVIGSADMTVLATTGYYGTRTSDKQGVAGTKVKHFTWDMVEKTTGLKPNVIIFDCEGCWYNVVKENKEKLRKGAIFCKLNTHPKVVLFSFLSPNLIISIYCLKTKIIKYCFQFQSNRYNHTRKVEKSKHRESWNFLFFIITKGQWGTM